MALRDPADLPELLDEVGLSVARLRLRRVRPSVASSTPVLAATAVASGASSLTPGTFASIAANNSLARAMVLLLPPALAFAVRRFLLLFFFVLWDGEETRADE